MKIKTLALTGLLISLTSPAFADEIGANIKEQIQQDKAALVKDGEKLKEDHQKMREERKKNRQAKREERKKLREERRSKIENKVEQKSEAIKNAVTQ